MAASWLRFDDLTPRQITPMIRQYAEAKATAPHSLLFFRMGDFYELFFEDALEGAELLGLTLTSRDGDDQEKRIPMAGVPVRAVDGYLARAIRAGRTVTICDQVEDPKQAKGIVRREVVRTVTPGTIIEADLLDERTNNYLAAIAAKGQACGLALVDISTGEFLAAEIDDAQRLRDDLQRYVPAELIVAADEADAIRNEVVALLPNLCVTPYDSAAFEHRSARDTLLDAFQISTLQGLDLEHKPLATAAAGALLEYIRETQKQAIPELRLPHLYNPSAFVVLDANTVRNLELVESMGGGTRRATLLGVLDKTRSSMGARLLRKWIVQPLRDIDAIQQRLGAVEALIGNTSRRLALAEALKAMPDVERVLGRLSASAGNARDVVALGHALERLPHIRDALRGGTASLATQRAEQLDVLEDVAGWIRTTLVDEPPTTLHEGGLICDGCDAELDRLRGLVRGGQDWIAQLQAEARTATKIANLRVGYNRVFGYYIEVTKSNAHLVPDTYQRKQTLANAERYVTPELKAREEEILTARERMESLEYEHFCTLRQRVVAEAKRIQASASIVAELDVWLSLAEVAVSSAYVKPSIADDGSIAIRDGRHPVVESLLPRGAFVPNDIALDPSRHDLLLLTGPNMAGKSTYLRQAALITLMAQIGAYVPATEAHIGVVDRIFTRVGASDQLARGESTFMVEMIEAATILNTASKNSLVILDEIGRGTSTFDGISIAWAVAEHIHNRIGAKTLFATHYHELTGLEDTLPRVKNLSVSVRERGDRIVFLYRIAEGGADHSYGIQVAKLAGLPQAVVRRAREVLEALESGTAATLGLSQQLQLFGLAASNEPKRPSPVEEALAALDPDALSPREAHDTLYRLIALLRDA